MAALAAIFASATGPANATERPEALDRLVRPNDRVTIRAVVASGTRYCTVRVGARSRTAVASGATEVRFSFRVARAPRVRSARVSLTCGSGASRHGILRVRSSARTGGALIDGTIHATAIRPIRRDDASSSTSPPPTLSPAAPPGVAWLSPGAALARATTDWEIYGAAYEGVFRNGQCTDWAQQKRPDIVRRATIQLWADHLAGDESAPANWNGGFWDDTARAAGLAVGTVPVAGAIVTFDPGTQGITAATGHVAFVESVSADGSFVVSEMNAPLPYLVTERRIPAAAIARGGLSFVY
jgi:hypothetical protein